MALEFADLVGGTQYTLTHILEKEGRTRVLFHDVPSERLREYAWDAFGDQPEVNTSKANVAEDLRRSHATESHHDTAEDDSLPGLEATT